MEGERENTGTTPAAGATPAETTSAAAPAVSSEDLDKVRALVLQAHPDVVGDLVKGASIDELIASVEPARTAYQQVAEKVRGSNSAATSTAESASTTAAVTPPAVPAGGTAAVVDPAVLSPTTKIAQALAARKKK